MSKVSLMKTSFNAGELSPRLDARIDVDKYSNGCSVLENFIPLVQGGIMKRPGTQFINATKNNQKVWLAKFEFNFQQSFILEFGPSYIRFYFNHGLVLSGGVPYEVATPYTADMLTTIEGTFGLSMAQTGDVIYIVNREVAPRKLSRISNTNWTLEQVDFQGGPFEDPNTDETNNITITNLTQFIGVPFTEYVVNLESTDPLFTSDMIGTNLEITVVDDSNIKPWQQLHNTVLNDIVRNDNKYYGASAVSGDTKTGYVAPIHTRGGRTDGDNVTWWYLADQQGIVEILTVTDSTHATGRVIKQIANTSNTISVTSFIIPASVTASLSSDDDMIVDNVTSVVGASAILGSPSQLVSDSQITITGAGITFIRQDSGESGTATSWSWAKAAWRSSIGFPELVVFFRERLVFARDQKIWFSVAGDYENFAAREFGEVLTDSAISIDITSEDASPVKYLVSTPQGLICGTNADQVLVTAASISEPFGPNNVRVSPGSGVGGKQIKPAKIDQSVLMIQRSGRKLCNTQYDAPSDFFITPDLTVISDHILKSGVNDMAWQRDPWSILWLVRNDGQLVGCTFNQQQQVQGFHRHVTDGNVEAVQVIPAPDGSRDDLWMVVNRTIDGETVRYVELLEVDYMAGDDQDTCWYSDCALEYQGSAATTISGLGHLVGKEVQVLADGAMHPNVTVNDDGEITLQYSVTHAIIGLPYSCTVQTMRLEGGANNGTSQGKVKRIDRIILRLLDSMGKVECAPSVNGNQNGNFDVITFHNTEDYLQSPPPIFTGDKIVELSSQYNREGQICIKQSEPFPFTLLGIMPDLNTYER